MKILSQTTLLQLVQQFGKAYGTIVCEITECENPLLKQILL
jgi:hypothetical protein